MGPCWPPQGSSESKGLLLSKVTELGGSHTPQASPYSLVSVQSQLVLIKAPGVALCCFDRKYIKPRFTENTESGFMTSLGPWLPAA